MFSLMKRFSIAIMFALLAAGVTLAMAKAQSSGPTTQSTASQDCASCHTEFADEWKNGPHGQAVSDPVFTAEWEKQGKPGACLVCHTTGYDPSSGTWLHDGVSCEACHGPMKEGHPQEPMPVDRTSDLCARCHSDARFNWGDWQQSTHYQRGMDCVTCHDPHSASLKITKSLDGTNQYKDASQLCVTCHKDVSMDFPYSQHHQKGVSCIDCHVTHTITDPNTAHTVPDHSFKANIASCNTCHAQQMHTNNEATGTSAPASTTSAGTTPNEIKDAGLTPQPNPVNPIGFAGLAGLIGLAGGMVLAPWLEKWYRQITKRHPEE